MLFKATVFTSFIASIACLQTISVKGNTFFAGKDRFYLRGLAYQPGGDSKITDALADTKTCERDIQYFKELGINALRVYHVDNTADHDECMKKLEEAGIYVIIDTNLPKASIARDDGAKCSYNSFYLEQVFATIKQFSVYDNTLGFFVANEVINDETTTAAATYVKAVVRDAKLFIKQRGLRDIPVGYSAADVSSNRLDTAHFFNCGDDPMARVDMFGFNDYSWCGKSSFKTSGYDKKVESFNNYSIPIFFSEFGCNEVTPRVFTEVEALYSEQMTSVFSGGIVYEYTQETNKFGLVKIDGDSVNKLTDFYNLKSEFEKTKNPSGDGGYHKDLPPSECPAISSNWNATNDIPNTPNAALKFIYKDETPKAEGLKAETQWKCSIEPKADADLASLASQSSKSPSATSSGGSSKTGSSSSSSSKAGADIISYDSWLQSLGVFAAGLALI